MNDLELENVVRDALGTTFPTPPTGVARIRDISVSRTRRVLAVAAVIVLCAGVAVGVEAITNRGHGNSRPPAVPVGNTAESTLDKLTGRFWVLDQITGSHGTVDAADHPTLRSHGVDGATLQFSRSGVLLLEDTFNTWNDSYTLTTTGIFIEAGASSLVGVGPGVPQWVGTALQAMDAVADPPGTIAMHLSGDQLMLRTADGYDLTFQSDGTSAESGLLGSNDDYSPTKPQVSPLDAVRGRCRPGQVLGVDGIVHIPPVAGEVVGVRWTADPGGTGTVHTAVVQSQANGFLARSCG